MAIYESGEMYLESILLLSKSKNIVRAIDICEQLRYSKPSVSRALARLKEDGFILVASSGAITLTDAGREIAENIYDRHVTLTKALLRLGVSEETATADACKIEHDISDESFYLIKKNLSKNEK